MATPQFWADPTTEPKRAYRWLLRLGATVMPSWVVTKVSQPNFEVSEQEHQFINHKFYYPGRVTWSDVSFTLVDPVTPDAADQFQKLLARSGYKFPNDGNLDNVTDTPSKARSVNALGKIELVLYAPDPRRTADSNIDSAARGREIGTWKLTNAWVKSITHSELSYESEDLVNTEVTLRYDWAQYKKGAR